MAEAQASDSLGRPKSCPRLEGRFLNGIPPKGGVKPLGPTERPWDPLEKPSGTFGARLWTASQPLSNGARASTWTYPITAHRRCHCSRPPRVAWHTPPLLPNKKDARGPHKKDRETPDRPHAPSRGSGAPPATKPIPFRLRNWAPSPLRSRGSKARPPRVSTTAPGQTESGMTKGEPVHGRGPSK